MATPEQLAGWRVSYLGGHPLGGKPSLGVLSAVGASLVFEGGRGQGEFTIPLAAVSAVESKSEQELRVAPSGYLNVLGLVAVGYGKSLRHPVQGGSQGLKGLLVVRWRDEFSDEQVTAFGNWFDNLNPYLAIFTGGFWLFVWLALTLWRTWRTRGRPKLKKPADMADVANWIVSLRYHAKKEVRNASG